MNNLLNKISSFTCHPTTRRCVYLATIVCFILCVVLLLSNIKTGDSDYKKRLDSLDARSRMLEQAQTKYDSLIAEQQRVASELDIRITNIKEKTTIIREYYIKQQAKVNSMDHNQLDSFFRTKYQY